MRGFLLVFGGLDPLRSALGKSRLGTQLLAAQAPQPLAGNWVICADLDTGGLPCRMTAVPFSGMRMSGRVYGVAGSSTPGRDAESTIRDAVEKSGRHAQALINGEYCFYFVDTKSNTLHASVDLFGVRGLYCLEHQGLWAISDSCSALLALFGPQLTLNGAAIAAALIPFSEPCSERGETFYAGLRLLRAGEWLTIDLSNGRSERSQIGLPSHLVEFDPCSLPQLEDALRAALRAALQDRLTGGHAALTLSGGIDSALLAAQLTDLRAERPGMQIRALTSVLRGDSGEDEARHADLTARALKIDQQRTTRDPGPIRFPLASLLPWAEHPMALYDDLSQVRQLIALGSPSLSGLGADELIATSLRRPGRKRGFIARLQRRLLQYRGRSARPIDAPISPDLQHLLDERTPPWIARQWHDALPRPDLEGQPTESDGRTWHDLLLPNVGFCTDVEARDGEGLLRTDLALPYLDQRVVRVLLNPGVAQLDLDRHPAQPAKQILRRLLRGRVPEAVVTRRKSPAGQPIFARFSGPELADLPAAIARVPMINDYLHPDRLPVPDVDRPWSTLYPLVAVVSVGSWLHHQSGVEIQWITTAQ